jgi:hypothetical protein
MRKLPPRDLALLTQIDYERAMAFIAEARDAVGLPETLGAGLPAARVAAGVRRVCGPLPSRDFLAEWLLH